jgi:exosortase/archaeosortase family protein
VFRNLSGLARFIVPARRGWVGYLVRAAGLMAVFYALLYFPYPPGSLPLRAFAWYLHHIALAAGAIARLFDGSVTVADDLVQGRFSLRIVLDCAALDAHALFAAAVLAFPAPWSRRAAGVVAGTVLIALVNLARIVALYVAGLRWPASFHLLHEEVLQMAIILATFVAFAGWILWARPLRRVP